MAAHSRLSPSSAHRWLKCPGSVRLCEGYSDVTSVEAAEGSAFHQVAGECLDFGLEPEDFVGQKITIPPFEFIFDEEMAHYMRPGLDRVRELAVSPVYVETRVPLDEWISGQFGTLDAGFFTDTEICIFDWKYGSGVPVSPVLNPQLMLYGLGFYSLHSSGVWIGGEKKISGFRFIIEQPRAPGGGGEWTCSVEALLAFGDSVREIEKITRLPDAPLNPGPEQCRFCPARPDCQAFAKFNLETLSLQFEDLDQGGPAELPHPDDMTPDRRSYVVQHAAMVRTWLDDVHARVLSDALAGHPTPGLKAVIGRRGWRNWRDVKQAEEVLRTALGPIEAYNRKLKSPAQAERLIDKKLWEHIIGPEKSQGLNLITQDEGRPVLVSADDKRPAIPPGAMFADLTQQGEPDD